MADDLTHLPESDLQATLDANLAKHKEDEAAKAVDEEANQPPAEETPTEEPVVDEPVDDEPVDETDDEPTEEPAEEEEPNTLDLDTIEEFTLDDETYSKEDLLNMVKRNKSTSQKARSYAEAEKEINRERDIHATIAKDRDYLNQKLEATYAMIEALVDKDLESTEGMTSEEINDHHIKRRQFVSAIAEERKQVEAEREELYKEVELSQDQANRVFVVANAIAKDDAFADYASKKHVAEMWPKLEAMITQHYPDISRQQATALLTSELTPATAKMFIHLHQFHTEADETTEANKQKAKVKVASQKTNNASEPATPRKRKPPKDDTEYMERVARS